MFGGKLDETTLRDSWVKKLIKTYDPGPLASLIEDRIRYSATGPFRSHASDEKPTEIIDALIAACPPSFRAKIEPAAGLMIYKAIKNHSDDRNDILSNVFFMIRENRFLECRTVVRQWLDHKASYAKTHISSDRETYHTALITFAHIQKVPDPETEKFWLDLWSSKSKAVWRAAFFGLRKQNPALAISELECHVERNGDKNGDVENLPIMWRHDVVGRGLLEKTLREGIDKENGYCALALNRLLEQLDKAEQDLLLFNIKQAGSASAQFSAAS